MLTRGDDVPEEFSGPEVLAILRQYYAGLNEKVEVDLHGLPLGISTGRDHARRRFPKLFRPHVLFCVPLGELLPEPFIRERPISRIWGLGPQKGYAIATQVFSQRGFASPSYGRKRKGIVACEEMVKRIPILVNTVSA